MQGINEEREKVEVDSKDVRYFGTEVEKAYNKDGSFKKFITKPWVKTSKEKVYLEDWKISDLKHHFINYDSRKEIHTQDKKGKTKKATEWKCEVLEEGVKSLNHEQFEKVKLAVEKKRPFLLVNESFYYIKENIFRSSSDDMYYYFDKDNSKIVNLDISVYQSPTKEKIDNKVKEYINRKGE